MLFWLFSDTTVRFRSSVENKKDAARLINGKTVGCSVTNVHGSCDGAFYESRDAFLGKKKPGCLISGRYSKAGCNIRPDQSGSMILFLSSCQLRSIIWRCFVNSIFVLPLVSVSSCPVKCPVHVITCLRPKVHHLFFIPHPSRFYRSTGLLLPFYQIVLTHYISVPVFSLCACEFLSLTFCQYWPSLGACWSWYCCLSDWLSD